MMPNHNCSVPDYGVQNHIAICAPFFQDVESWDDYERMQEQDEKKHMTRAERDSGSQASRDQGRA